MANLIEQAAGAIRSRLAGLVGEQQQLLKALGALEGLLAQSAAQPAGRAATRPESANGRRGARRRALPCAQQRRAGAAARAAPTSS